MIFYTTKNIGQSGGASRWRVCYQRGLPRLVFKWLKLDFKGITLESVGKKVIFNNHPCVAGKLSGQAPFSLESLVHSCLVFVVINMPYKS